MKPLRINGKLWVIFSETASRLVLIPAKNPLREWREKQGITQREACERLGLHQATYAKYELGQRKIPERVLYKVVAWLRENNGR